MGFLFVFLARIMPHYEHVLIVRDFNIHASRPDKPQALLTLDLVTVYLATHAGPGSFLPSASD